MTIPAVQDLAPHHVCIAVPDMEKAIAWYEAILGFEVEARFYIAGIAAHGAFLRRPELRIEMFQAEGVAPVPEERRSPNEDLRTGGTKHIAFTVPDLQALLPELVSRGVDIAALQRNLDEPMSPESDPLAPGKPPVSALFVRDPAGTLIELMDRRRAPA